MSKKDRAGKYVCRPWNDDSLHLLKEALPLIHTLNNLRIKVVQDHCGVLRDADLGTDFQGNFEKGLLLPLGLLLQEVDDHLSSSWQIQFPSAWEINHPFLFSTNDTPQTEKKTLSFWRKTFFFVSTEWFHGLGFKFLTWMINDYLLSPRRRLKYPIPPACSAWRGSREFRGFCGHRSSPHSGQHHRTAPQSAEELQLQFIKDKMNQFSMKKLQFTRWKHFLILIPSCAFLFLHSIKCAEEGMGSIGHYASLLLNSIRLLVITLFVPWNEIRGAT